MEEKIIVVFALKSWNGQKRANPLTTGASVDRSRPLQGTTRKIYRKLCTGMTRLRTTSAV